MLISYHTLILLSYPIRPYPMLNKRALKMMPIQSYIINSEHHEGGEDKKLGELPIIFLFFWLQPTILFANFLLYYFLYYFILK